MKTTPSFYRKDLYLHTQYLYTLSKVKFSFADLAVGAPYEEGGGTVYIYSGSDDGIILTPSQVRQCFDLNTLLVIFLVKNKIFVFLYAVK